MENKTKKRTLENWDGFLLEEGKDYMWCRENPSFIGGNLWGYRRCKIAKINEYDQDYYTINVFDYKRQKEQEYQLTGLRLYHLKFREITPDDIRSDYETKIVNWDGFIIREGEEYMWYGREISPSGHIREWEDRKCKIISIDTEERSVLIYDFLDDSNYQYTKDGLRDGNIQFDFKDKTTNNE